jgi:succinoglycan biosynthesis transport protein ExoP
MSPVELTRLFALGRRWWWLLLLGLAIGCGAGYVVSRAMTPIYRASATLLVNETQTPGTLAYNDILTSERLTRTYRELITQRPVLEDVIADLKLTYTTEELKGMLSVEVIRDTQLIRVSAESADPQLARRMADSTAAVFIEQNTANQISRPGAVSVVESATTPSSPVSPRTMLNTILGAFAGLVIAAGIALLLEYLDDTVKSAEDLAASAGLVALGAVARFRHRKSPEASLVAQGTRHPVAEAYRVLRTNVQFSTLDKPSRTFVVTSANPGEGKTTTVANLALVMAQTGKRVIAVDSDLRRPRLHQMFGVGNSYGLTSVLLSKEASVNGYLQRTAFDNLAILPSGPIPPNPSELLSSPRLEALIENLKRQADIVVFDSPPTLAVTDASVLAAKVDGAILVVDAGKTRAGALQRAKDALARSKTNLLGAVLNKLTHKGRDYYYYHHYYETGKDGHKRKTRTRRAATERLKADPVAGAR